MNFTDKDSLTLKGIGSAGEPSKVVCSGGQSGFLFQSSSEVTISNLQFQDCGANMSDHLYGGIFFNYSCDMTLSHVLIQNFKGYGLHVSDYYGNITIEKSHFIGNIDGNVVFWFKQFDLKNTSLNIYDSSFCNGTTTHGQNATGLYLLIFRGGVKARLMNLTFMNNTGKSGGNVAIRLVDFAQKTSTVMIKDCHIEKGNATDSGGGMNVWFEKKWEKDTEVHNYTNKTVLNILNTKFSGNIAHFGGGGVLVTYYERPGTGCTIRQVNFSNCTFINNIANRGSAIEVSKHKIPIYMVHNVPQFSVTLRDCVVKDNHLASNQINEEGILEIFSVEMLVINNSTFVDNNGTALMLVNSGVRFFNNTVFENNRAVYGGAIKLCDSSVMYFENSTRVKFLNNTANSTGGAIYAGNQCLQETPPCFFQISFNILDTPPTIEEMADDILYFEGNHAGIAGHAIYGGSVDNCFTDTKLRVNRTSNESFYNSLQLFYQISNFSDQSEISLVTSDPYGVCLCDITTNITNCTQRELNSVTVHAGELFIVNVSAVGQTKGPVPSKILLDSSDKHFKVEKKNREDEAYNVFCHPLKLVILPENESVTNATFKLGVVQNNAVSESSTYYRIPKLIVNVEILPCPFLFELNKNTNSCDCPQPLKNKQVKCNISTRTVIRPSNTTWIGCILDTNATTDKCGSVSMSGQMPERPMLS